MKLLKMVSQTIPTIKQLIATSNTPMALDLIENADELIFTELNTFRSTKYIAEYL
jgi:hypothetical protein